MKSYKVQHSYRSGFGGPFAAGDVVELTDEEAELLNRDSPGLLRAVKAPKQAAPKSPAKDRDAPPRDLAREVLTKPQETALRKAGLWPPARIRRATDEELAAVDGIGEATVKALREALPPEDPRPVTEQPADSAETTPNPEPEPGDSETEGDAVGDAESEDDDAE